MLQQTSQVSFLLKKNINKNILIHFNSICSEQMTSSESPPLIEGLGAMLLVSFFLICSLSENILSSRWKMKSSSKKVEYLIWVQLNGYRKSCEIVDLIHICAIFQTKWHCITRFLFKKYRTFLGLRIVEYFNYSSDSNWIPTYIFSLSKNIDIEKSVFPCKNLQ